MKKWLVLVLFIFIVSLTGCSNNLEGKKFKDSKNFKTLNDVVYPNQEYEYYDLINSNIKYSDFQYLNNFMNVTAKELFISEENYIYSPISLYMALGMLVQGADGDTKDEILSLLNGDNDFTISQINSMNQNIYNHNYYKNKKGMARIANSIWIRNDFSVKEQFLNDLTTNYYANVYSTNFDSDGKQNIADWINYYTNDLLKIDKDTYPLDCNITLVLINTLYFDNKWKEEFKDKDLYKDKFYGKQETTVQYMKHITNSLYYETDQYQLFYDYFENQNKITYIFPKQTSSVNECLQSNVLNMNIQQEDYLNANITLSVPKFKTNSSYKLNETLEKLGLTTTFNPETANFSKMSSIPTSVSFIQQDAAIILSEEGVKAAAATVVGPKDEAVSIPEIEIEIVLNRPFIYVISDSCGVPLFVGVVNNPKF